MLNKSYLYPNEPPRFDMVEIKKLFLHATRAQASDITIQTGNVIFGEIFGRLFPITLRALSHNEVCDILNELYGPNGTTQLATGRDIDTNYELRPSRGERYRYRVNGTACMVEGHEGIQITIRTIPAEPPLLSDLNLDSSLLDHLAPEQGVVIVTGSTGSGKTTLLASIIRKIAEDPEGNRKILTYEAPIEFVYDGINTPTSLISQSEIPKHIPNFAYGVRNALRRKPRLILVGEARDPETMAAVIDAALTGHPVYTTLHSNGVADCIRRMITTFPAEERHGRALDLLETLRTTIWQKLVPTLDGKRIALREYLVFTEEIRDILIETPVELLASKTRMLLKTHGKTLLMDAEEKLKAGLISERVFKFLAFGHQGADVDAGL